MEMVLHVALFPKVLRCTSRDLGANDFSTHMRITHLIRGFAGSAPAFLCAGNVIALTPGIFVI